MTPRIPARRTAPTRGKRAFATTWWGRAWVAALESSTLDSGRLSRGRTYARQGMVGDITITPGSLKAPVQGSRPRPYRATVFVPALTDAQWDTLLTTITTRVAHTAALLDGEMPEELVTDAESAGVPLLPGPHELDPDCSCPDWGYPCKHAAALCYALTTRIDNDPFVLFALRGRDRDRLLADLRSRRTTPQQADEPKIAEPVGVPAGAAFAAWPDTGGFTAPPLLAAALEPAPALPVDPPADSNLAAPDLAAQARDTIERARRLLTGDIATLHLTAHQDTVRLTASGASLEWFHALQTRSALPPQEFARLTRAWRHGGAPGLVTAETLLTPAPAAMAAARTALTDCLDDLAENSGDDLRATGLHLRTWRNRLTLDPLGVQIRLGPDHRWHPYTDHGNNTWWPCAPADHDPVAALTAACAARP